ncbi:MAG: glycosyltransferase family 39 protein [Polyangiaceae bacterium]
MTRPRESASPLFAALLFFGGLLPRLLIALTWAGEPVWDGHYYDFGARRIAAGLGYSDDTMINGVLVWHPWAHYPVGYSAFLGFFYRVFGQGPSVAPVVNSAVGALLALVVWLLARHALTEGRSRLAGILVAGNPELILYAALLMTEPLAALLTLLAFWLAVRDASPRRGLVLGALTLGVAALVRPQALLCAPFFALVYVPAISGRIFSWISLRAAIVACVLALVPVLPWTARNCRVMDGCALVSTNAGWNLAIGAFPRATGRFETLHASDGCRIVTGQVQQDRCWLHYGIGEIEAHPWHFVSLIPAKLGFTFDHASFAVEYLHEARPGDWPQAHRENARSFLTTVHRLLLLAAALGVIALGRAGRMPRGQIAVAAVAAFLTIFACSELPAFWPIALFAATVPWLPIPGRASWPPALLLPVALLGTTALTHAVFFGEDRYHVVVTPVLCLLAAAALRRPMAGDNEAQRSPI